ncbi:MAG: hypothetical protein ACRDDM_08830 [Paraclostridium sp.]
MKNEAKKYFEELGTDFLPIPLAILEEYNGLTREARMLYIKMFYSWLTFAEDTKEYINAILDIGTEADKKALELLFESGYVCEDTYRLKAKSNKEYNTHYGVFQRKQK